jgi:hypothetical protein
MLLSTPNVPFFVTNWLAINGTSCLHPLISVTKALTSNFLLFVVPILLFIEWLDALVTSSICRFHNSFQRKSPHQALPWKLQFYHWLLCFPSCMLAHGVDLWASTKKILLFQIRFIYWFTRSLYNLGALSKNIFQQSAFVCPSFPHKLHFLPDPNPDPSCLALHSGQSLWLCPTIFLHYTQTVLQSPIVLSVLVKCTSLSILQELGASPWHFVRCWTFPIVLQISSMSWLVLAKCHKIILAQNRFLHLFIMFLIHLVSDLVTSSCVVTTMMSL